MLTIDRNFREHKNMADKSEAYHHITPSFLQTETQTKPSHLQNKKIKSAQWSCKKSYIERIFFSGVGMKSCTKKRRCDSVRKAWRIHPNSQPASKIRRICLVWVNDWGKGASNSPFSLASPRKLTAKTKPLKNHGTGRLFSFQNGPFSSHITCIFRGVPSPSFFFLGIPESGLGFRGVSMGKGFKCVVGCVFLETDRHKWSKN